MAATSRLSSRAYYKLCAASSWEEIFEAGPYYDRIRELLDQARNYVIFAGWQIDSRIKLNGVPFREKVIHLCEERPDFQIYFLMWDHSLLYVPERESWQGRVWDQVHPRIHFVFDNRHPFGASHHEKVCLIDGKIALSGGIDLCDERWDSPSHLYHDPRRSLEWKDERHGPYHDMGIQVTGPICAEIHDHLARRWRSLSCIPFPEPHSFKELSKRAPFHSVYLSRTIAEIDRTKGQPTLVREIEFLFRDLISSAKRRVILEGQYYWSRVFHDMLIAKIHEMRGKEFEVILILSELRGIKSFSRYMMGFELQLLRQIQEVGEYAGVKVRLVTPYALPPDDLHHLPPRPIYIHSKVLIVDDQYLSIGSANFATRALRLDTEIQLTLEAASESDRFHIRKFAQKLLLHWSAPGISLREFNPKVESSHLAQELDQTRGIPWETLFDPILPWFYPIKRIYEKLRRNRIVFGILAAAAFFWMVYPVFLGKKPGMLYYSTILSILWLFPASTLLVLMIAAVDLGPYNAAKACVFSLWIVGFLGYFLARSFPTTVARFQLLKNHRSQIHLQLGHRKFETLLDFLINPRLGVGSKILFQGLYCIPFSWFFLTTILVLPGAYFLFVHGFFSFVLDVLPTAWSHLVGKQPELFILGTLIFCVMQVTLRIWKNAG